MTTVVPVADVSMDQSNVSMGASQILYLRNGQVGRELLAVADGDLHGVGEELRRQRLHLRHPSKGKGSRRRKGASQILV